GCHAGTRWDRRPRRRHEPCRCRARGCISDRRCLRWKWRGASYQCSVAEFPECSEKLLALHASRLSQQTVPVDLAFLILVARGAFANRNATALAEVVTPSFGPCRQNP